MLVEDKNRINRVTVREKTKTYRITQARNPDSQTARQPDSHGKVER